MEGPVPGKRSLTSYLPPRLDDEPPIAPPIAPLAPPAGPTRRGPTPDARAPFWFAGGPGGGAPAIGARVQVVAAPAIDLARAIDTAAAGTPGALPYRAELERAFGRDLGHVRAHLGVGAALRGTGLAAAARGSELVFGDASPSRELVAHEVAHVVQADRGGARARGVAPADDAAEREADQLAPRAARGEAVEVAESTSAEIHAFRAQVIQPDHQLVGLVFQVVGWDPSGAILVRTDDGRDVILPAGSYQLLPDAPELPPAQPSGQHPERLDATRVLVQADFMSGDRYGIAAALTLDDELGLVLLTTGATRAKAEEIKRFYDDVLARIGSGGNRVGIVVVDNPRLAYVNRDQLEDPGFKALVGHAQICSATYGTQIVGDQLRKYGSKKKTGVPAFLAQRWFGEPDAEPRHGPDGRRDDEEHSAKDQQIQQWLVDQKIYGGRYALIWCKTGAPDAEKAHHFTSPVAARQLIEVALKLGRTPILVGDDLGIAAYLDGRGFNLGAFWDDPSFPCRDEGRLGQLRLFRFLANSHSYDCVNVGMRSGALEGPALMGMQTVYLEEEGNAQARRLEKWLPFLHSYHRVILKSTPGGAQRRYLADLIADKIVRVQREAEGADEDGYVDEVVPVRLVPAYVQFLTVRMEYLRFHAAMGELMGARMEGFEVDDLANVMDLLERSSEQLARFDDRQEDPAFSRYSPSYADLFLDEHERGDAERGSGSDDESRHGSDDDSDRDGHGRGRGRGHGHGSEDDDSDRDGHGRGRGHGSDDDDDRGRGGRKRGHDDDHDDLADKVFGYLHDRHEIMGRLGGHDAVARMVQTTEGPMLWDILQAFRGADDQLQHVLSGGRYRSIPELHHALTSGELVVKR